MESTNPGAPIRLNPSTETVDYDFNKLDKNVRSELRKLTQLDNWHAPVSIALDYVGVAASIYICTHISWWFYPLALLYIGSTQRGFVNLLHESTHKVLTKSGRLNVLLGTVFTGYAVFHMYNPYRASHIGFHHRYLGDPERDPDYSFHKEIGIYDHTSANANFFLKNIVAALLGLRTIQYVKYVIKDRILFDSREATVSMPITMRTERIALSIQWLTILIVSATLGWLHLLLMFWIIPLFTVAVAIGWLTELAEHYPLPESENAKILMTRNRHGWALERFLFGRHNDNYHLVHHLNTGIPYWNMKCAHNVLMNDPCYRAWDQLWSGILTRKPSERGRETLVSYASKYRTHMRNGHVPTETTYARAAIMGANL